jgi:hypothetical protein
MMAPGGQHARISATPAAREAVIRLRAARGEFIVGSVDLLLGEIEGCPFYIYFRLYEAWNKGPITLSAAARGGIERK